MNMIDNFESALEFAMKKHRGQLDKGWTPYIQHLLGVWSRVRKQPLVTQIAALLHDTVEDTDTTLEEIEQNFGTDVVEIIRLLTHQRGMKYAVYIENIAQSGNASAIMVKIADLQDNVSEFRFQRLPEPSRAYFKARIETKYNPARTRLLKALEELALKEEEKS